MSARRTERLLNLVICLLATPRWLTRAQIREAVPQYAGCESDEAFGRMFERDKEDLRELGVPIVTGSDSSWFEDELGYRIDREAYALPPVDFTAAELAVLGLASRVWQQASLAGPAAQALIKLSSLGVEPDEDSLVGVEPRVRTAEPSFDPLYAATRDHAPVAFFYRKPESEPSERRVEPWALVGRQGHWYLVGRDRDRDASRVFRLSRIESDVRRIGSPGQYTVPADLDPHGLLGRTRQHTDQRVAMLRIRSGRGGALRHRAVSTDDAGEGWQTIRVEVGDVSVLADEVAGYGPDVVVTEPADLKAAVIHRLRAALAASDGPLQPPLLEPAEA